MFVPPLWVLLLMPFSVFGPQASPLMGGLHVAVIVAALYGTVHLLRRGRPSSFVYFVALLAAYFAATFVCNLHLLIWAEITGAAR